MSKIHLNKKTAGTANRLTVMPLLIAMILLLTPCAYATPQSEYQKTLDQKMQIQQQIDQNQHQIDEITSVKKGLQAEYDALQTEVEEYEAQISKLDELIFSVEDELEIAHQELDDKFEAYYARVRNLEEYGTTSYWSIIFDSQNLADLLSRMDYVNELMVYEENSITTLESTVDELNAKAAELAELRADRNYAAQHLRLSQNKLYNVIERRIKEIQAIEDLNDTYRLEIAELTAKGAEILGRINGQDYHGTTDPDAIYQKYVVESGMESITPQGAQIVKATLPYVGGEYVWGGASPEVGFDCSGMMYYVYGQFGYSIQRTATQQYIHNGVSVGFEELQAGDLVFFHPPDEFYISHVGMYIGDGLFVHAASRKSGIKVSSLHCKYYTANFFGAKRII